MTIYETILRKKHSGKKQFALLIDPDNTDKKKLEQIAKISDNEKIDYIFLGGSLIRFDNLDECIKTLKKNCSIPIVLFPGSPIQINKNADALLFLSLISGRNPELLIGQHVMVASLLKQTALEIIPTGYMLIDGGSLTTALYMSNTTPIPADKYDIAINTAIAGELLGLKLIYMDAGSGAINFISSTMVKKVRENISVPLIVGGGIKTAPIATELCKAGADIIVVGNAVEQNFSIITALSEAIHSS